MKLCNCCQQTKPIDAFYSQKRGIHGVKAQCKLCFNALRSARWATRSKEAVQKDLARQAEYRERNREKLREYHREWSTLNPEKIRAYSKVYRSNNSEQVKDRCLAWQKANPEKVVAKSIRWQKRHPERAVAAVMKREARKRQAYAPWDQEFTDFVSLEAAHLCKLREAATGIKWHVDHVIPLGGEEVCGLHVWNNMQVIPGVLNVRKGNKMIEVNWT